jgi:hypothetical protein
MTTRTLIAEEGSWLCGLRFRRWCGKAGGVKPPLQVELDGNQTPRTRGFRDAALMIQQAEGAAAPEQK